jgi:hypothetical protein
VSNAQKLSLFLAEYNLWRRGGLDDMPSSHTPVEIGTAIDEAVDLLKKYDELERENAALRHDKERLDWLGAQVHSSNAISYSWFLAYNKPDIYAAIEAARAEEGGAT